MSYTTFMDLDNLQQSSNVEDRRGRGGGGGVALGGGLGIGGVIIAVIFGLISGQNPLQILGSLTGGSSSQSYSSSSQLPTDDARAVEISKVLKSTEGAWGKIFADSNRQYRQPGLVLYNGATDTAGCGGAQAEVGPFYCPGDRKIYIDLRFFDQLSSTRGTNDFARAYVIAHEVAHHIQNELGVLDQVNARRQQSDERTSNALSVRIELQADCLAGVWANKVQNSIKLTQTDIREGLAAASSVGDDTLQREAGRRVVSDSFTHGSSAQRQRWFTKGFQDGSVQGCNTFSTNQL
jgi:uncharacterized protein